MAAEVLAESPTSPVNTCPWAKNRHRPCSPDSLYQTCMIVTQTREQGNKGGFETVRLSGDVGPYWEAEEWMGFVQRSEECVSRDCSRPLVQSVRLELNGITSRKIADNELV